MKQNLSKALKLQVAIRANWRCEYCLLPEKALYYPFHIDYIKSIKHGGLNLIWNLAFCCPDCNYHKGTDIGSLSNDDAYFIRFFNPRKDIWDFHFEISDGCFYGLTEIGEITIKILKLNNIDRLIFRKQLIDIGQYF